VRPDLPDALSELVSDLMEKDPAARPANAAQVVSRIAGIVDMLGPAAPEYEADRETFRAEDRRGAAGGTRHDEVAPEAGRSTVLTPERIAELSGPATVGVPPWELGGPPPRQPTPSPVLEQQGPPVRSAPQSAMGHGGGTPEWPTAQPPVRPRQRPAWRGVVSTLITAAIVAGVGVYLWERQHQTLKITGVEVTATNQSVGCNGTANIVGTISTNGHGGTISYQWVENNVAEPQLVADDASGSDKVQVPLKWAFHGKGSGTAVAELRVLDPQRAEASLIIPYSC
jgi:hypothetical protein